MPTFHQLDLRSVVNAYFDVQNIYNRQDPEGLIYNPHFTAVKAAVGVPILPVFGVRVEY